MFPLTLLLHGVPHAGDFVFPGLFHPGFFWVGLVLLCVLWKRAGRHGHHGSGHRRPAPAPAPKPKTPRAETGERGEAWPNLYPDDPSRQPQPPLEPKGKVEYF